jgi:hypothetical protein
VRLRGWNLQGEGLAHKCLDLVKQLRWISCVPSVMIWVYGLKQVSLPSVVSKSYPNLVGLWSDTFDRTAFLKPDRDLKPAEAKG